MAFETKPSHGALFKNERKQQDSHPDYRGDVVTPDGVKYELAAWLKTSNSGKKFMSLKLSVPREAVEGTREPPRQQARGQGPLGLDDDIPFAPHR
jgi:hypothetical protein